LQSQVQQNSYRIGECCAEHSNIAPQSGNTVANPRGPLTAPGKNILQGPEVVNFLSLQKRLRPGGVKALSVIPEALIKTGGVDFSLPLNQIAPKLIELAGVNTPYP